MTDDIKKLDTIKDAITSMDKDDERMEALCITFGILAGDLKEMIAKRKTEKQAIRTIIKDFMQNNDKKEEYEKK